MSMSHDILLDLCDTSSEIGEDWQKICFIDVFSENENCTFMVRRVMPRCEMSANDLCFCGSGRKHKKCHPDVNENSVIANLLKVYHQLDEERSQLAYSVCQKGCSDCCKDYFTISAVEFFAILRYLKIHCSDEQRQIISSMCKKISAETSFPANDVLNIPGLAPCVFLDNTTRECKIYEVRPIMCRTYGYYQGITRCPKISDDEKARQALLPIANKKELVENIDAFEVNGSSLRPKPRAIAYWFGKFENPTKRFMDLSVAASEKDSKEFIRIMLL